MAQTARAAVANAMAHIDWPPARRILMANDQIGDNKLPLKHEFPALTLGRRGGYGGAAKSQATKADLFNRFQQLSLRKMIRENF
jgi:hypothetical protein